MYPSNRIGTLAEKIVALRLRLDGTVTSLVRHREPDGRMVDAPQSSTRRTQLFEPTEFVARVRHGDSGVVAVGPAFWRDTYRIHVMPLGSQSNLDHGSGQRSVPVDDGSASDEVRFRFADGKLTWRDGNMFGESVLNETYPELEIVLRLPPGNEGELSFTSPGCTTASGKRADMLAVA